MISIEHPVVLVYRRTHKGDPNSDGIFGCNNCMGRVRSWAYDAVIGIGGKSPWEDHKGIECKVNWIGIGPERHYDVGHPPQVTFSKFILWDEKGPCLKDCAPRLFHYMFVRGHIPRAGKTFPDAVYEEILDLLKLARHAPPSKWRLNHSRPCDSTRSHAPSSAGKRCV